MKRILLISGNYTRSSGQSVVNEQVISSISRFPAAKVYIARGGSRGLLSQFFLVSRVALICLLRRIDIVYYAPSRSTRGILRDLFLYKVARISQKRLVVHWHGSDFQVYKEKSRITCSARNVLIDAVHICLCKQHEEVVRSIWPDTDILVLPNVLTDEYIESLDAAQLGGALGIERERIAVSMIGAIRYSKGIDIFCSLAKKMAGRDYEFHVYGPIVGDEKSTVDEVKALLDEYKQFLHIHGPVFGLRKAQAFLSTDILVLPSRDEAYPLVIIEALSAGCWVVSSDVGFIKSIGGWPRLRVVEGDLTEIDAYERIMADIDIDYSVRSGEVFKNITRAREHARSYSEAVRNAVLNSGATFE